MRMLCKYILLPFFCDPVYEKIACDGPPPGSYAEIVMRESRLNYLSMRCCSRKFHESLSSHRRCGRTSFLSAMIKMPKLTPFDIFDPSLDLEFVHVFSYCCASGIMPCH